MAETTDKPVAIGGNYFPSVKRARQRLQERADEIIEKYLRAIDMWIAAGEAEVANDAMQYLIEHMPREEGVGVIDESAAKPRQVVESGHKGPVIQIGVKVGGSEKALPEPIVIDVKPE